LRRRLAAAQSARRPALVLAIPALAGLSIAFGASIGH